MTKIFIPKEMEVVDRAIDFLAPHFGIPLNDDELWDKIDLPEVRVEPYIIVSRYLPKEKTILFTEKDLDDKYYIGHEVGHWFHHAINPDFEFFLERHTKLPLECVAAYAGIINYEGKNPIINPAFSLFELSRMGFPETRRRNKEINDFYFECLGMQIAVINTALALRGEALIE